MNKKFPKVWFLFLTLLVLLHGCSAPAVEQEKSGVVGSGGLGETAMDSSDVDDGIGSSSGILDSSESLIVDGPLETDEDIQTEEITTLPDEESHEELVCDGDSGEAETVSDQLVLEAGEIVELSDIPAFSGKPYYALDDNIPTLSLLSYVGSSFEYYSELDGLGRCGFAYACIGTDLMPTEKRGDIGMVKPTGWHTVKYDVVEGKYLYNRCHLIGYQLTAENANEKNLLTGTRYFNVDGMLLFENMVADYIKETGNHVLYRVTPMYQQNNLVAYGVRMEGWSVEDQGDGICFDVFVYNAQPGVEIDYATGESRISSGVNLEVDVSQSSDIGESAIEVGSDYVLNTNSRKFHYPNCRSVGQIKDSNRDDYFGVREELIQQGYSPCGNCKP